MTGYCFLTISNLKQPKVWDLYFDGDYSRCFCHPKYPVSITGGLKDRIIKKRVPTAWGHFSLVQATLNLFEAAFEDPEIDRDVLLSDSCVPLRSRSEVEEYLDNSISIIDTDMFKKFGNDNIKRRETLKNKNKYPHWVKHSQWLMMERSLYELVFKNFNCEDFYEMNTPDEHFFGLVLAAKGLNYLYESKPLTYCYWPFKNKHPATCMELKETDGTECVFLRKVDTDTIVTEDYLNLIRKKR